MNILSEEVLYELQELIVSHKGMHEYNKIVRREKELEGRLLVQACRLLTPEQMKTILIPKTQQNWKKLSTLLEWFGEYLLHEKSELWVGEEWERIKDKKGE